MSSNCIAPNGPSLAGYKIHRCRCSGCCTANRTYNQRHRRLVAYGRWQPLVDAEPVRQHVRKLHDTYSVDTIAALAGVGYATVNTLIWNRGGKPRKRVRKEVAEKILAVQPDPALVIDKRLIDATPTHRRIQALAAIGWSLAEQSRRLGRDRHFADVILGQRRVTAGTAREVGRLYDLLSGQPRRGNLADRTRAYAASRGWVPPAAWDNIDDPDEQPQLGGGHDDTVDEVLVRRAVHGRAPIDRLNSAERVELARQWRQWRISNDEQYGYKAFGLAYGIPETQARDIMRAALQGAPEHTTNPHIRNQRKVA